MKAKDFVRSVKPTASAERQVQNSGQVYWLIRERGEMMYMASGDTQAKAWKAAKDSIIASQP